jgi:hypothetical protein
MKKSALSVAVAATVASSAYAQMYVNSDHTGQYLIYPFYTADNGNETYIHVVNTTNQAKAVKVRILEAENSWEVRDFNLYLSPYDHFSFSISLDPATGGGRLDTGDTSCTVPQLNTATQDGVAFTNALFTGEENDSVERTINGHVEIIEMGQFGRLVDDEWIESKDDGANASLWLHDPATGEPADCEGVVDLWRKGTGGNADGIWFEQADPENASGQNGWDGEGTMWRGGGLYGMAIVANPDAGWSLGYDAVAVEDFVHDAYVGDDTADIGSGAHLHFYPGDTDPGLGTGAEGMSSSAMIFAPNSGWSDEILEVEYDPDGVNSGHWWAMAHLFQSEKLQNDYVLEPFFDGSTDWVVTFPTKHFHVNGNTPLRPFTNVWDGDEACDRFDIQTWDREEMTYVPPGGYQEPPFSPYTFTPDDPVYPEICYETNVLTFGYQEQLDDGTFDDGVFDSVFWDLAPSASSSRIHTPIGTPYHNGWAELTWSDPEHYLWFTNGQTNFAYKGLPAVGFAAVQFENGTINDGATLATYASAHEHKLTRVVSAIAAD